MKFRMDRDFDTDEIRFCGSITSNDRQRMDLSPFDRALLRDCDKADATAADRLLGLELLFRRGLEASLLVVESTEPGRSD